MMNTFKRKWLLFLILFLFFFGIIITITIYVFLKKNEDLGDGQINPEILESRDALFEVPPYECEFDMILQGEKFKDSVISESMPILRYDSENVSLKDSESFVSDYFSGETIILSSKYKTETAEEALDEFLNLNELVDISYSEIPNFVQEDEGAIYFYEKVPLYQSILDTEIYIRTVDVWTEELKYYQVLFTTPDSFVFTRIDSIEDSRYEVKFMSKEEILELFKNSEWRNRSIFPLGESQYRNCKGEDLSSIQFEKMSVVYVPINNEYLYPFLKIEGEMIYSDKGKNDFSILIDGHVGE